MKSFKQQSFVKRMKSQPKFSDWKAKVVENKGKFEVHLSNGDEDLIFSTKNAKAKADTLVLDLNGGKKSMANSVSIARHAKRYGG